jgi:hypothetical protein
MVLSKRLTFASAFFFFTRWEPPIGKAPEFFQEFPVSSSLKRAFRSLAWYASQDAEAWKMLAFLVGVLTVAAAIASTTCVPFSF